MKSRIIALALIILFLFPLTIAPIDRQHLIPEPVRTNVGSYEDDFSDVSTWVVEGDGGGSVESDGDQATFSMPAVNFEDNFYRTIPTENLYLTYYEFNVTAFYNLNAEFRIYQSGTYHQICSISAIGNYNGTIYTELSAASRISFLLEPIPSDSGNMTIDYLNIVPLWSASPFSETLDDDVLHYPDLWNDYDVFASSGTVEYYNTYIIDAATAGFHDLAADYLDFETVGMLEGNLTYSIYLTYISTPFADIRFWDWETSTFDEIDSNFGTSAGWYNGTFSGSEYVSEDYVVRFSVYASAGSDVLLDYMIIDLEVMTGSGYAESFADVSDYEQDSAADLGTDGDVMYVDIAGDSAYDYWYTNTPSLTANVLYYAEYRIKRNASANHVYFNIMGFSEDDKAGDSTAIQSSWYVSQQTFTTIKIYFQFTHVVESVRFRAKCGVPARLYFDYFRIGPSHQMGWQHDGSTIEGVTNNAQSDITYTTSTNEDILTLRAENTGGANQVAEFYISLDPTSTTSAIDRDYYPFFQIRYNATLYNGAAYFNVQPQIDGYYGTLSLTEDGIFHTRYGNHKAFSSGTAENRIKCYARLENLGEIAILEINYAKIYSIADYTITESSTTPADYLYVSEGILYSNMDTGTITLDYDPTDLSFVGVHSWNKSTSYGTSELSFYRGSWSSYYNTTQGDLMGGTLTDIRLRFSEDANIINIILYKTPPQWHSFTFESIYFDLPNWHGFTFEDIIFYLAINVLTLSYIMMLMGLVMIPVSTLFLVMGGRSDMSRDKMFLFLMIFLFGWAFFLGGIL